MNVGVETLSSIASRERARWAAQVLFLVMVGGLVAVARRYGGLHLGIPGHTGLLWMFLLVAGRAAVRRDGAGVLIGISAALWGETMGLKHSLPYNMMLYAIPGLGLDMAVRAFRMNLANPLTGMVGGAMAHGAKFLFILGYASGLDLPKQFLIVGKATAFGSHLMFGAAGGLLAGAALWLASRRDSPRRR